VIFLALFAELTDLNKHAGTTVQSDICTIINFYFIALLVTPGLFDQHQHFGTPGKTLPERDFHRQCHRNCKGRYCCGMAIGRIGWQYQMKRRV
jgi:hypothetical protein